MHRVIWGVHRTSLCLTKVCKKMTAQFGLTPSRYHLLQAMKSERSFWFPQCALRELLGITAQTISRTIKSLVACGFLVQRVVEEDKRRRELSFTAYGRRMFRCAFGNLVKAGLATHIVGRALTDEAWPTTLAARTIAIASFDQTLSGFRLGLRDMSIFDYSSRDEQPPSVNPMLRNNAAEDRDSTPNLCTLDDDAGNDDVAYATW